MRPLPQHDIFAVAPHAPDRPALTPDLHLPGVMVGFMAFEPGHTRLSRVRTKIQHGSPSRHCIVMMGQPALAPGPHLEAVGVLLFPEGTSSHFAEPRLSQVGARGTPIQRGSDNGACPVPHGPGTAPTALGPGGEVGDDAVPRARHQAGLLEGRPGCEMLADLAGDSAPVQLLEAAGAAALQAVLRCDASPGLTAGHTGAPSRNLPLEQLQVPVADLKAPPVAFRLLLLVAVRVMGCPALGVGAPDGPAASAP